MFLIGFLENICVRLGEDDGIGRERERESFTVAFKKTSLFFFFFLLLLALNSFLGLHKLVSES